MTFRSWLYNALVTDAELNSYIGGRIFAKKTMSSSVEEHPYIVFKLGNETTSSLSEEDNPSYQFFQLYVHDYLSGEVGDYGKIDSIIRRLKKIFHEVNSKEHGLIQILFLETSQDLDDQTLGTLMKYIRFQAVLGDPKWLE